MKHWEYKIYINKIFALRKSIICLEVKRLELVVK
jgi:hypothetical protein